VFVLNKEINEILSDLRSGYIFGSHSFSKIKRDSIGVYYTVLVDKIYAHPLNC
jgi:hypothetical protein